MPKRERERERRREKTGGGDRKKRLGDLNSFEHENKEE